jgi:altronate hydrolase
MNTNFEKGNKHRFLQIHPLDNVLVALQDMNIGEEILFNSQTFKLSTDVSAKHKFALVPFKEEDKIYMYGVLVGRASKPIALGESITMHLAISC